MKKAYMSPEKAAPLLGIAAKDIRRNMRNGSMDLGIALDPKKTGRKTWTYKIYPAKLYKITGEMPNEQNN